ncbi:hypothetical protein K456DRAFT_1763486 [Colletotrichum gloeosporioides 23]|nr:hypothetical protein K456DRAFT_1763486 [Colletotrichum gloeosporioides 23]
MAGSAVDGRDKACSGQTRMKRTRRLARVTGELKDEGCPAGGSRGWAFPSSSGSLCPSQSRRARAGTGISGLETGNCAWKVDTSHRTANGRFGQQGHGRDITGHRLAGTCSRFENVDYSSICISTPPNGWQVQPISTTRRMVDKQTLDPMATDPTENTVLGPVEVSFCRAQRGEVQVLALSRGLAHRQGQHQMHNLVAEWEWPQHHPFAISSNRAGHPDLQAQPLIAAAIPPDRGSSRAQQRRNLIVWLCSSANSAPISNRRLSTIELRSTLSVYHTMYLAHGIHGLSSIYRLFRPRLSRLNAAAVKFQKSSYQHPSTTSPMSHNPQSTKQPNLRSNPQRIHSCGHYNCPGVPIHHLSESPLHHARLVTVGVNKASSCGASSPGRRDSKHQSGAISSPPRIKPKRLWRPSLTERSCEPTNNRRRNHPNPQISSFAGIRPVSWLKSELQPPIDTEEDQGGAGRGARLKQGDAEQNEGQSAKINRRGAFHHSQHPSLHDPWHALVHVDLSAAHLQCSPIQPGGQDSRATPAHVPINVCA